jgi:hypothetical protein
MDLWVVNAGRPRVLREGKTLDGGIETSWVE